MKRALLVTVFVVAGMSAATAAPGETWCLKSFGQERGACVFPSARECAQAARFNAFGGVCEREGFDKRPTKKRTSSR